MEMSICPKRIRAMGQITIGIRKEIAKEEEEIKKADTEEIQIRKVTLEKEIWKIITVYNSI